jgi:toxoflavin synthase
VPPRHGGETRDRAAYQSAFTQSGFRNFAVHMPEVSTGPDGEPNFWDHFLKYPSFILLDCVKH